MSWLIVKICHLKSPRVVFESILNKSSYGKTLTDFKVTHKQDGTSRRFGFVGYKTDKEALVAKE